MELFKAKFNKEAMTTPPTEDRDWKEKVRTLLASAITEYGWDLRPKHITHFVEIEDFISQEIQRAEARGYNKGFTTRGALEGPHPLT